MVVSVGIDVSKDILLRSVRRANTTMSRFLMLQKSWFV